MQRITLMLVIPHLGGGGAEQIAFNLACNLSRERFNIHLCLLSPDYPGSKPPPSGITTHRMSYRKIRRSVVALIRLTRKIMPDVILSGIAHLNFLFVLIEPFLTSNTKLILRQNTSISASNPSRITRLFYRHLYPRAAAIICQSQAMADDLVLNFNIAPRRLVVLQNPVDLCQPLSSHPSPWREDSWPRLLAVGRLAQEKGFDLLIAAFAQVLIGNPDAQLAILGQGPMEARLRQIAATLHLEQNILFAGYTDPGPFHAQATVFVLSSRHEGMPNALLQAAAAGLPLIATPCCQGVIDLLTDQPATWLCPMTSSESLAETLLNVLPSLQGSERPMRFDHGFLAPFESSAAILAYETLIAHIAATGKP